MCNNKNSMHAVIILASLWTRRAHVYRVTDSAVHTNPLDNFGYHETKHRTRDTSIHHVYWTSHSICGRESWSCAKAFCSRGFIFLTTHIRYENSNTGWSGRHGNSCQVLEVQGVKEVFGVRVDVDRLLLDGRHL